MGNREETKRKHEKAVADQLLKVLTIDATFERLGNANNNEPDVIYKIGGRIVGVEVATAYYEDTDAKDEWEIAAGEKSLAPGEIRPRSRGVLGNPDQMICERVQAELDDKCAKAYAGIGETWLCINEDAPLSDAASIAECVNNLRIPAGHRFAKIYLTYTAPAHEDGQYKVVSIL
jgi:hypothetical protein